VLDLDWSFWWPGASDKMKDRGILLNYLDDVAAYMFENDMMPSLGEPGTYKEKQNVRTYTVGFRIDNILDKITERINIMKSTASRGGGRYIEMNNPLELDDEFEVLMNNILKVSGSFGGVSAPVSPDDKSYTGNYAYMSMFKAVSDEGRRIGNLKKYNISETGLISNKDEWSGSDSPELEAGGVRSKMLEMKVDDRKIYTTKNSSTSVIEFKTGSFTGGELTKYSLDDSIISNIRAGGQAVDGKPGLYVLGDIIHSIPLIYRNGSTASVFAGANDGMLHCFDESTGNEKWAFIPESQLSRLKKLVYPGNKSDAAPYYFIDGGKTVYDAGSKKILIFGERRGGKNYYGLDITDSGSPKPAYTVSLTDGFGQSWSNPRVVPVIHEGESKNVFWIGGGYDAANQDKYNKDDASVKPAETDSVGKGVYAVNADTGEMLITPDNSGINNCIVDPVSFSPGYGGGDDPVKEESHSRLYACDVSGSLWGYRQDTDYVTKPGGSDTDYHQPGDRNGNWNKYKIFSSGGTQRKVFHRPEVVLEIFSKKTVDPSSGKITFDRYNGEYVYFGTGDREHPSAKPANNDLSVQNRFYCVKNSWDSQALAESVDEADLKDVTAYPFDTVELSEKSGWYVRLETSGEKVVSYPVAYRGMVFFTTYTPADDSEAENPEDPCEGCNKLGKARLYILNYKTGEPVINLSTKGLNSNNEETDNPAEIKKLCKADRVLEIGEGMPGSPSLIFPKNGGSKIMVGVGDKIYTYDLDVRDMTFYYWREAF
jgi:type IV pilus assembly protein PilY1